MNDFANYEKSFRRNSAILKRALGPEEGIKLISMGGCADDCYKKLETRAMEKLRIYFGKNRFAGSQSKLEWVHSRPKPRHLQHHAVK